MEIALNIKKHVNRKLENIYGIKNLKLKEFRMKIKISDLKESEFSKSIYVDSLKATPDLIESIRINGVLAPIWISKDNMIISGHRRVDACRQLGIEEIEAEVREYSDLLVIESNRHREKTWKEKLNEADALEKILKPKAKQQQLIGLMKGFVWPNLAKREEPINTREEVSKRIGVSHGTLGKVKIIAKDKPELLEEIDNGTKSVDSAYQQVKIEKAMERGKNDKPEPDAQTISAAKVKRSKLKECRFCHKKIEKEDFCSQECADASDEEAIRLKEFNQDPTEWERNCTFPFIRFDFDEVQEEMKTGLDDNLRFDELVKNRIKDTHNIRFMKYRCFDNLHEPNCCHCPNRRPGVYVLLRKCGDTFERIKDKKVIINKKLFNKKTGEWEVIKLKDSKQTE